MHLRSYFAFAASVADGGDVASGVDMRTRTAGANVLKGGRRWTRWVTGVGEWKSANRIRLKKNR